MSSADIGDPGHGHSPAAWVAVIVMLLAFVIGTFAFWFEAVWLVIASAVLLVIGALTGWILAKVGYGVGGTRYRPLAESVLADPALADSSLSAH